MGWRSGTALLLAAWGGAAEAGITATYALVGEKTALVVETGDHGEVLATLADDPTVGLLVRDGRRFFLGAGEDGASVIPVDDLEAVLAQAALPAATARDFSRSVGRSNRAALGLTVTGTAAIGRRTVVKQEGVVYRIDLRLRNGKAAHDTIVVSEATALRPLAAGWAVMSRTIGVLLELPTFNTAVPGLAAISTYLARVTALGALLDMPSFATLTDIRLDTTPPPGRFDLPAVPLGRPELEEMIRTAHEG